MAFPLGFSIFSPRLFYPRFFTLFPSRVAKGKIDDNQLKILVSRANRYISQHYPKEHDLHTKTITD
jgi:hypothetical protein